MHSHTVRASEFKQKCLMLMEEVASTGTELIITKHGKPVCKLTPLSAQPEQSRFGWMKDTLKIKGDLTAPIGKTWEATR